VGAIIVEASAAQYGIRVADSPCVRWPSFQKKMPSSPMQRYTSLLSGSDTLICPGYFETRVSRNLAPPSRTSVSLVVIGPRLLLAGGLP